jgi:Asp-tRNA(Asn)/Glu-tRNA(Gln) amidotransferase A subunit family amidase
LFNRNWTLARRAVRDDSSRPRPHGLPLGVQIVGRYDDDERVLQHAQWVGNALA